MVNLYPWFNAKNGDHKEPYDQILIECKVEFWLWVLMETVLVVLYGFYLLY